MTRDTFRYDKFRESIW